MSPGENGPRPWYTASGFCVSIGADGGGDGRQLFGRGAVREHVTARHQGEFSRREQPVTDDELVRRPRPGCGRGPIEVDAGPSGRNQYDVALAGGDQRGRVEDRGDPQ